MKRYLILQNGKIFEGEAIGAKGKSLGELVFTTGMCGYIETLTDPSYYGQIVIQTFPQIGNYGFIPEDAEGKCAVKGYVVNTLCENPSNFREKKTLNEFLRENKVVGISGVDTRELTKILRDEGVMNAMLCDEVDYDIRDIVNYSIKNPVAKVTSKGLRTSGGGAYRVALIDYGAKRNIERELISRNCTVTVYPSSVLAEQIIADGTDGIMLSNGPGDPQENVREIEAIKSLLGVKPIFGICLGHQLLALANGGKTRKMKYGHRGVNQPVKDLIGGGTYITSQNHGYEVIASSVKKGKENYENANDGTCEGIIYADKKAFSVQFHPEAASGPHDTSFLFDKFVAMMEAEKCR